MASLDILPQDWRERADRLDARSAEKFTFLGQGVWVDDDCPLQPSIIVIDGDGVFRLNDSPMTDLVLKKMNWPDKLRMASLLATTETPSDLKTPPPN